MEEIESGSGMKKSVIGGWWWGESADGEGGRDGLSWGESDVKNAINSSSLTLF